MDSETLQFFLETFSTIRELDQWASEYGYSTNIHVNLRRLELQLEGQKEPEVTSVSMGVLAAM